jgi:hypothetical protein
MHKKRVITTLVTLALLSTLAVITGPPASAHGSCPNNPTGPFTGGSNVKGKVAVNCTSSGHSIVVVYDLYKCTSPSLATCSTATGGPDTVSGSGGSYTTPVLITTCSPGTYYIMWYRISVNGGSHAGSTGDTYTAWKGPFC